MTILRVRHITSYAYKRPVGFGEHRVLFRPRDSYDQRLLMADIDISPTPSALHWIHDVFGNCVALVDIDLGDESGFDLARRLADGDSQAAANVILISTHDEREFADLIEASPAIGFLAKTALSSGSIQRLLAAFDVAFPWYAPFVVLSLVAVKRKG